MSRCIAHKPCPKCLSRDNLGVYDDGHSFCFGCGLFMPAPKTIEALKQKLEIRDQQNVGSTLAFRFVPDFEIPVPALQWLRKYGITDHEIKHYGICWNQDTQSLVFPMYGSDKQLLYYQERYFGADKKFPKYMTYGNKRQQIAYIRNRDYERCIILVEDFVSAIKVGRVCSAAPLLGSNISAEILLWLATNYKRVRVWLDFDKASHAVSEAAKCSTVVADSGTIITQLDPKEYSTNEITRLVSLSFRSWNGDSLTKTAA